MPAGQLLDALADQVELGPGQGDDVEGVHDRGGVGQFFGRGALVAAEAVHGDHLDLRPERRRLLGQPCAQRCRGASGHEVEQPRRPGAVVNRGEVDDQGDEPFGAAASWRPAVLVDPDDAYPGQSIGVGRRDHLGHCAHGDRADGVPGDPELGGDRRDGGAVEHQPAQHIPGTTARRR